MTRRVAETGQVRAALIAGPGYLGGLRSISDPDGDAFYELVALSDGAWATWDPGFMRGLSLKDAGLAVGLLDLSSDFAVVLDMRLDERSFESARERLAAILTRYGKVIFDTPHPVAQRADLAAMSGTSRVMMYRALRGLEADGLIERQHGGGVNILDAKGLAGLVTVAPPTVLRLSDQPLTDLRSAAWCSTTRAGRDVTRERAGTSSPPDSAFNDGPGSASPQTGAGISSASSARLSR